MTRSLPVVKSNSNSALLDRLNHEVINYVNKLWTDRNWRKVEEQPVGEIMVLFYDAAQNVLYVFIKSRSLFQ